MAIEQSRMEYTERAHRTPKSSLLHSIDLLQMTSYNKQLVKVDIEMVKIIGLPFDRVIDFLVTLKLKISDTSSDEARGRRRRSPRPRRCPSEIESRSQSDHPSPHREYHPTG